MPPSPSNTPTDPVAALVLEAMNRSYDCADGTEMRKIAPTYAARIREAMAIDRERLVAWIRAQMNAAVYTFAKDVERTDYDAVLSAEADKAASHFLCEFGFMGNEGTPAPHAACPSIAGGR